jgi:hypothetical protein
MITKQVFENRIKKLGTIKSKTGTASYSDLKLDGNVLSLLRENTGKRWPLNVDGLYNAYSKESYFNTVVLRKHIGGRVYSPALAVLMAIKVCDAKGNKINEK